MRRRGLSFRRPGRSRGRYDARRAPVRGGGELRRSAPASCSRGRGRGGGSARLDPGGAEDGLCWLIPFERSGVIKGRGALALEILAAAPDLDVLVVPGRRRRRPDGGVVSPPGRTNPASRWWCRGRPSTVEAIGACAGCRRWRAARPSPRASLSRSPGELLLPDYRAVDRRTCAGRRGGSRSGRVQLRRMEKMRGRKGRLPRPGGGGRPSRTLPGPPRRPRAVRRQHRAVACSRPLWCACWRAAHLGAASHVGTRRPGEAWVPGYFLDHGRLRRRRHRRNPLACFLRAVGRASRIVNRTMDPHLGAREEMRLRLRPAGRGHIVNGGGAQDRRLSIILASWWSKLIRSRHSRSSASWATG